VELQELLRAHGFALSSNGDYDSRTEAALKAFQAQQGLHCTSIVEAETWLALKQNLQPGARLLKRGDSGSDVYELQGLLRVHGYTLERDGCFGSTTEAAVQTFQQQQKLKKTGIVDPITWTLLRGRGLPPAPPPQRGWFFEGRKWF
jgi:peptidoglycan hydrolase-like protein with peptidoglycan-binding domain